jgi:predicted alpha/beta superfamily hydrolase
MPSRPRESILSAVPPGAGGPAAAAALDLAATAAREPAATPPGDRAPRRAGPVTLPRSEVWEMSAGGDAARAYRLQIAWPAVDPPAAGFPVVYLLDGDAVFPLAVGALRAREGRGLAPAILVGIGYPGGAPFATQRRRTDYAPPGSAAFLDFLLEELVPAVEQCFPADPGARALFGHSLAGLLVLQALLGRPGSFRHLLAASPSIWWGDGAILPQARAFAAAPPPEAARLQLLLTAGELESDDPRQSPERRAQLRARRMGGHAREMAALLGDCLPARFHEFAGETHGSVLPAAVARALQAALGGAA